MVRLLEIGLGVPSQELGGLPKIMNIEIFSWLPVKTIFSCRCVCRTWYHNLSDPYFAKLHHSRSPSQLLLQCLRENNQLVLAELDENLYVNNPGNRFRIPRESIIDLRLYGLFPNPVQQIMIHHSYNVTGFLVLEIAKNVLGQIDCYIYHPLMKKLDHVQFLNIVQCRTRGCVLGYCESVNQLKLLRFYSTYSSPVVLMAEMQTIGGGDVRWNVACPPYLDILLSAPFVNGRYHWRHKRNDDIYSFDFEEEEFESFPGPDVRSHGQRNIVSLEGRLHIVYCAYWNFELWVLDDYNNKRSWTKLRDIFIPDVHRFPHTMLFPLRYVKNGEMLMRREDVETLIGCNLLTRRQALFRFYRDTVYIYTPFSYTPSFLGLRPQN